MTDFGYYMLIQFLKIIPIILIVLVIYQRITGQVKKKVVTSPEGKKTKIIFCKKCGNEDMVIMFAGRKKKAVCNKCGKSYYA